MVCRGIAQPQEAGQCSTRHWMTIRRTSQQQPRPSILAQLPLPRPPNIGPASIFPSIRTSFQGTAVRRMRSAEGSYETERQEAAAANSWKGSRARENSQEA
jgi:hypothetical protein